MIRVLQYILYNSIFFILKQNIIESDVYVIPKMVYDVDNFIIIKFLNWKIISYYLLVTLHFCVFNCIFRRYEDRS